jgi:hypothetical protein
MDRLERRLGVRGSFLDQERGLAVEAAVFQRVQRLVPNA